MIVRVPPDSLSPEAFSGLIEEYVTRDGTDYGEEELPLAEKTAQVRKLVNAGELVMVFNDVDERSHFLTKADYEKMLKAGH